MLELIDWRDIARPLDVSVVPTSEHHVRRWTAYETHSGGITFACETVRREPLTFRVDVVADDVFRIRMGAREGVARRDEQPSEMLVGDLRGSSAFVVTELSDMVSLQTSRVRLDFVREPWQLRATAVLDDGGVPFFAERVDDRNYGPGYEVRPVGLEISVDGLRGVREAVAVMPGEGFFGLGEKFTPLNKWGQELVSWAVDSGNVTSPRAYKNIPFFMSTAGYGVFVHTGHPIVYHMGSQSSISYSFHVAEEVLDYFLIYGPAFTHILARYAELTGRAQVPPKWSFGFWLSRAGYRSRAEVESIVSELRHRDFPCDVISLDPWWMGDGPWCTYSWDEDCFPDPRGMMASLRKEGFRTCLWIHPYLPRGSALYEEAVARGFLVMRGDSAAWEVPEDGVSLTLEAFTGAPLGAIDFTNPLAVTWFQDKLEALLDDGVAVFKTDFGEQAPVNARYHDGRDGLAMHNLYPLLYNKAVYELTERKFGRGLTWGRSGYAGSQRYPVQWGGDSYASLDQMAGQLRGLLSYGMSGISFCSHDVGGFDYSPGHFDEDPDLVLRDYYRGMIDGSMDATVYLRWLQFGVFSSHVRAHGKPPREPWRFGEAAESIARRYLTLRYRLLPYIYSQAVESARQGLPMVRPMVLMYQEDPTTWHLDQQYLFGADFLVAPVFRRDGRADVYLPAGEWVDYWTKERLTGPRWLKVVAALDRLPLWVRSGAIIPLGPKMKYVGEKALDPLTLEIYAPSDSGHITIHEEDGPEIDVQYRRDRSGAIVVHTTHAPGMVEVAVYASDLPAQTGG